MRTLRIALSACLALALALPLAAIAADNSAVLGKWTMTLEFQGRSFDITLEFTETDGELAGTWTGPRATNELTDVAFDGETLTFKRTVSRQGNEFTTSYTAKVAGDKMDGMMQTPRGERPFTATRQ